MMIFSRVTKLYSSQSVWCLNASFLSLEHCLFARPFRGRPYGFSFSPSDLTRPDPRPWSITHHKEWEKTPFSDIPHFQRPIGRQHKVNFSSGTHGRFSFVWVHGVNCRVLCTAARVYLSERATRPCSPPPPRCGWNGTVLRLLEGRTVFLVRRSHTRTDWSSPQEAARRQSHTFGKQSDFDDVSVRRGSNLTVFTVEIGHWKLFVHFRELEDWNWKLFVHFRELEESGTLQT